MSNATYRITFKSSAAKELGKLDKQTQKRIRVEHHRVVYEIADARCSASAQPSPFGQHLGRHRARIRICPLLGDCRRRPGGQDLAALVPGAWADVDNVVGLRDHPQVVLDDDHCGAVVDKAAQLGEQQINIRRV